MSEPIVKLEAVTKSYGEAEAAVLSDLSMSVEPGKSVAIVGPSGCGKSTLLNLIGGLDAPTSGTVWLGGRDLTQLNEKELAEVRGREVGFVFQDHHLLPQCTALENVLIPTLALRETATDSAERGAELLRRVGLGDRADSRPGELSGGQRQRVAIVRALINQPGVLLIDEPTGALDGKTAEGIVQLLAELNEQDGVTLLLVTHDLGLASRMRRVMRLNDGRLVEEGAA